MRMGLTSIDWAFAGASLARTGDDEQAVFLKAFIEECLSWGTHFQVEQQLASVNLLLTKEEREILKMLSYNEED